MKKLQRHHLHLRRAGDRGLPQRGAARHRGAGRAGAALERRALARAGADGGGRQAGRRRLLGRRRRAARRAAGSTWRAIRRPGGARPRSWTALARARPTCRRRSSGCVDGRRGADPLGRAQRQFAQRRGHFLVTNGPYQLEKWTRRRRWCSQVFRDFTNPLGRRHLRSLRHPAARLRRAHHRARRPARDRAGDRARWRSSCGSTASCASRSARRRPRRTGRRARLPLRRSSAPTARWPPPASRRDGARRHRLVVDLKGRLKPGAYTALVALALGDNLVNPEVATAQFRVDAGP